MKIALVHDYLREYGGAERVVEAMHEIWPEAPLYTSFVDFKKLGIHASRFKPASQQGGNWDIRTSWVQNNPIVKKFHSPLRFLAPNIWESFDLSEFDVVLTSSGWFMCRGVIVKKPAIQICYIHHPPRNLYGYPTGSNLQKYWPVRVYTTIINFFLRHYDFDTAQKVDYFIANSKETAKRVQKFYRRESTVIYPPIDLPGGKIKSLNEPKYYLSVGRLSWAKRTDLAIIAANKMKFKLKIVGSGSEEKYLRSVAGPTVEFLGSVDDDQLDEIYRRAKALIFSALEEDFGMVPVEAMAHGVPVIALGQGGTLETVLEGKTGILYKDPTVESLVSGIKKFESLKISWKDECLKQAKTFSKVKFKKELKQFVEDKYSAQSSI